MNICEHASLWKEGRTYVSMPHCGRKGGASTLTSARNFRNLARSWRGPGTTLANLLYTLCEKSRLEPPNFCWKYLRGNGLWYCSLTPEPKFSQLHMEFRQLFSLCPPKDFSQHQPSLGYPGAAPPPVENPKIDSQMDVPDGLGSSVLEFRF